MTFEGQFDTIGEIITRKRCLIYFDSNAGNVVNTLSWGLFWHVTEKLVAVFIPSKEVKSFITAQLILAT